MPSNTTLPPQEAGTGVLYAIAAFLIWGLSPVFWKMLSAVPPFEILMHRVVWSFLFFIPLILRRRQRLEFSATLKDRRTLLALLCSTILVAINWYLFIWSVNHGRVLQASLGYYITPLVNVFLGLVFLKERLRPFQIIALVLAGGGVFYLAIRIGNFPWVAMALALTFGLYGLIRKVAAVGAVVGLFAETLVLSLPASAYLIYLGSTHAGAFLHDSAQMDAFLVGTAMVTALPLLCFTLGARRLRLTTLGFLQYIAPSCNFLLAIFLYREPFTGTQLLSFALIWTALGVFTTDSLIYQRRLHRKITLDDF